MAHIKATTTTQDLQVLKLDIDLKNDTYKQPDGTVLPLSKATPAPGLPLVQLPAGSMIVGGAVLTTEAITATGGSKTGLRIFDAGSNTSFFNTDNIESVGARPLSANPLVTTGQPLMVSILTDAADRTATKGKVSVLLHIINVKTAKEVVA